METVFCLVTFVGIGYGMFRGIKWLMQSGRNLSPREQPLSPQDLKVLEEAAAQLMADLRAAADDCVARLEKACDRAEQIMASRAVGSTYAATGTGLLTGEIELLRGLEQISRG